MATNLQIDDRLIQKAVKLGGHKTKKSRRITGIDRIYPTFRAGKNYLHVRDRGL